MKSTIVTALTLALLASQPLGVSAQHAGTPSELADDALTTTLWQIAVSTHTRIGFQSIELVHPFGRPRTPIPIATDSLDDALDAAIATNPGYEWRRVGDFVVVRPTAAWHDVNDPFNRQIRQFRAQNTTESQVLRSVTNFIHRGRFDGEYLSGTPVAFAVESGTLIDVMDKLIESADLVLWQAAYRPHAPEERYSRYDLELMLANATGLRASSESHLPSERPQQ